MSQYYAITIEEMRAAFAKKDSTGKGWAEKVDQGEIVFDYEVRPGIVVRVRSSLSPEYDTVRFCGSDCIKVYALDCRNGEPRGLVKSQRVLRVKGWHHNLKARILEVSRLAVERMKWNRKEQ